MVHSAMNVSLTDGQKVSVTYQKKQKNCTPTLANHNCHSHGPAIKNKLQQKNKELSGAKFGRLIEEGLEPHPGPNIQPRQAVHFNIVTQHCSLQGAWRVLATYQNCVLILQNTPFTEAGFAILQLRAKKSQLKVYHNSSGYQDGRKVGGVTTLIPIKFRQDRLPDMLHRRNSLH